VELGVDGRRANALSHPSQLIDRLADNDTWAAASKRALARLHAYFLIAEDPQRRLDARDVETLSHQVSLVRHILDSPTLRRVLIADEVGLGKTVEIGLLLKELLASRPSLRVLYLAPARLVTNVRRELDKLDLHFRQWTSTDGDARLSDGRIIASIHRAIHGENPKKILAAPAWDILIVDECHHLSAWDPGGGDPREAYKLVRDLILAQPSDGRTVFLSGTPHQGNVNRFENLVALLRREGEPESALSGRVIYRTKDDVQDWHGNPLFPRRQVNEPVVVDLGPKHQAWITNIHNYFKPPRDIAFLGQARQRAAGWRCMQALQWAASSPHAGLGYLVRQAVRAGWTLEDASLADAISALRPYRLGSPDEPVPALFMRIQKEVARQHDEGDVDDIEEDSDDALQQASELRALLVEGTHLVRTAGDDKWEVIRERLLTAAGREKVVLFAQPVETVTALARYLHRITGKAPAIILGGQSDAERTTQVESFRDPNGPQFLVSSRAGGEGINLQVARRLIHIDVPWNPMDMEQRVGRVHRFGSRQTILVDTLVVKDSREADAYRIAREKLHRIASAMVEPERFEAIFSRVMCLVPPESLQAVLINQPTAPFSADEQDRIAKMVQEGFQVWKDFHQRFGAQQNQIRAQDPGLAEWSDVEQFLKQNAGAELAPGFSTLRFKLTEGEVQSILQPATVLRLADSKAYACGDFGGLPVTSPEGGYAAPLGLNVKVVNDALRECGLPTLPTGAAHVRWGSESPRPALIQGSTVGILGFSRQTVRTDKLGWSEHASSLVLYAIRPGEPPARLEGGEKQALIRGLVQAIIRVKPEIHEGLLAEMRAQESALALELRRPTPSELESGVRHAVSPILAALVS
jgi:superfamily II DNA or RNA helicase